MRWEGRRVGVPGENGSGGLGPPGASLLAERRWSAQEWRHAVPDLNHGGRQVVPLKERKMLDKILFWVVLVWMIGMLVMTFFAVREVIKDDSAQPPTEDPPRGDDPAGNKTA